MEIDRPVITGWLGNVVRGRMQGDIYRLSTVECDRWQILIKERFEHDDFVSMIQESREDGVLTYASWLVSDGRCQKDAKEYLPSLAPLVTMISESLSRSLLNWGP